jgi:hypothetical protein
LENEKDHIISMISYWIEYWTDRHSRTPFSHKAIAVE